MKNLKFFVIVLITTISCMSQKAFSQPYTEYDDPSLLAPFKQKGTASISWEQHMKNIDANHLDYMNPRVADKDTLLAIYARCINYNDNYKVLGLTVPVSPHRAQWILEHAVYDPSIEADMYVLGVQPDSDAVYCFKQKFTGAMKYTAPNGNSICLGKKVTGDCCGNPGADNNPQYAKVTPTPGFKQEGNMYVYVDNSTTNIDNSVNNSNNSYEEWNGSSWGQTQGIPLSYGSCYAFPVTFGIVGYFGSRGYYPQYRFNRGGVTYNVYNIHNTYNTYNTYTKTNPQTPPAPRPGGGHANPSPPGGNANPSPPGGNPNASPGSVKSLANGYKQTAPAGWDKPQTTASARASNSREMSGRSNDGWTVKPAQGFEEHASSPQARGGANENSNAANRNQNTTPANRNQSTNSNYSSHGNTGGTPPVSRSQPVNRSSMGGNVHAGGAVPHGGGGRR